MIGLILACSLFLGVAQGADSPDAAIEEYQKALRDKKWDLVYDWQSPSDRQRIEKEFRDKKIPNVDQLAKLLGMTEEELFKLTPRQLYTKLPQKLEEMEPGYFAVMANAKFEKKTKDGENWVYEHEEKTQRNGVPTTSSVTMVATKEAGKWYISQSRGGERAERRSNEHMAAGTLRSLAMAEADFKSEDRDGDGKKNFWVADVRGLFTLKGKDGQAIRLIEVEAAGADAAPSKFSPDSSDLKTGPRAGYRYASLKSYMKKGKSLAYDEGQGRSNARFGFVAYPEKYGAAGKVSFLVSEDNVIWMKDTGGKVPEAFPEDPAKDGWEQTK